MDYNMDMDSVLVISNKVEDKTKKNRRLQNEYLLNNIIDKDFQAMLYPLTLVPSLFLMSQFSIINNFITPENGVFFFMKYVAGSIIFLLTHFFRFQCDVEFVGGMSINSDIIIFLFTLDLICFSVISIFSYIVHFAQRSNTVELIIRLQDVLNCIKIDKLNFLAKQKKRNWFSVLMVVSVYVLQAALACENFAFLKWLVNFLMIFPMLICDIQVVVVSCIIEMIKDELLAWKKIMEEYEKTYITSGQVNSEVIAESDMFHAYVNIIKAFGLCCKVYTFSVSYYIFQTLLNILIGLEFAIELEKMISEDLTPIPARVINILFGVWNMKSIIIIVLLSVACESFHTSVKNVESVCAHMLGCGQTIGKGMRVTCKNVLRLNHASLRKLSAFGAFELDATFPLRLLGGIVAYTVVLLQFAFLS